MLGMWTLIDRFEESSGASRKFHSSIVNAPGFDPREIIISPRFSVINRFPFKDAFVGVHLTLRLRRQHPQPRLFCSKSLSLVDFRFALTSSIAIGTIAYRKGVHGGHVGRKISWICGFHKSA
jgi:hypothetical protein